MGDISVGDDGLAMLEFGKNMADKNWRMTSGMLYKVKNKSGEIVPFIPNMFQAWYLKTKHKRNLFLKVRQVGVSTVIQLDYFDDMAFSGLNLMCGVITQDREATQRLFEDKILLAFNNLPSFVKEQFTADTDNANQLTLTNRMTGATGTFRVATSFRSGTIQRLHVSELGPIATADPLKAREINKGSIEAVAIDGMVSVESTSSGDSGLFYDMCEMYSKKDPKTLSPLDFKFYFFPWYLQSEYEYSGFVHITDEYVKYFADLERDWGVVLSDSKKKWYVLKSEQKKLTGKNDMFQEYPSVYKEAFWASVEGAYFDQKFDTIMAQGRISNVPYDPAGFVYTVWDLGGGGGGDDTVIWWFQVFGNEIRWIDYWEGNDQDLLQTINFQVKTKPYRYGRHIGPHDLMAHHGYQQTRFQLARSNGIEFFVVPQVGKSETIQLAKNILSQSWFDKNKTLTGYSRLKRYKKKYDRGSGKTLNFPDHNEDSHASDAFQYGSWRVTHVLGFKPKASVAPVSFLGAKYK